MRNPAARLIMLAVLLLPVTACNAEKKMARQLVQTADSISVCLMEPAFLLMQNLKTWEIPAYDSIPKNLRDSVAFFHSRYLQYIDDSLFMNHYTQTLKKELVKYGIRLFPQDSMNSFLASGGTLYLINVAQFNLEEYQEPFKKSLQFDTTLYKWEIWCNALALNVWYEVSVLNVPDQKMKLLFGNMYVRDNVDGRFSGDPFAGTIRYLYNVDTIDVNSSYRLAGRTARIHANYLFDYILNERLARKEGSARPPEEYLHYDPEKRKIRKAGEYRLTEITD